MRTHVFFASTAFGLASLAAAAADDMFPDASRRVLVLSNNAVFPETAYGVADVAGMAPLIEEFDAVYSYNDAVAPYHPTLWQPQVADRPIWERSLRSLWALEGDLHLVVENVHVAPAFDLCQTFVDATIDVYAEGLFSYGPTRNALPPQVGMRVQRLLPPRPGAWGAAAAAARASRPVAADQHRVVPQGTGRHRRRGRLDPTARGGVADRSAAGPVRVRSRLLTAQEELQLYLEMVEGTVAAGFAELVFKAHPRAGRADRPTGPAGRRAGGPADRTRRTGAGGDLVRLRRGRPGRGVLLHGPGHRRLLRRAGDPGGHRVAARAVGPLRDRQPDGRHRDRGDRAAAGQSDRRRGPVDRSPRQR